MFGRLIWTALLAAVGYIVYRFLRGEEPPPPSYQPVERPTAYMPPVIPPIQPKPMVDSSTAMQSEPVPVEVAATEPEIPAVVTGEEGDVIEAYCASCRQRRTISGAHPVTASNGRAGMRGTCTSCGASVFTFTKKK
jgi:Domain of unknown function (DUF5679)